MPIPVMAKLSFLDENLGALKNLGFGADELKAIDAALA